MSPSPAPHGPLRRLLTGLAMNTLTLAVVAGLAAIFALAALVQRTGDGVGQTLSAAVGELHADRAEVSERAAAFLASLTRAGTLPVLSWSRRLHLRSETSESWLRLLHQRASLAYSAHVVTRYGVALDAVRWSDLRWLGTGKLQLRIPPAVALEHRLVLADSEMVAVDRELGAPEPARLLAEAQRRAVECVAEADQRAALSRAAERAVIQVARLGAPFGFPEVEVIFDGEVAPAPLRAVVRATLCHLPLAGQLCATALARANDPCDAVISRGGD